MKRILPIMLIAAGIVAMLAYKGEESESDEKEVSVD